MKKQNIPIQVRAARKRRMTREEKVKIFLAFAGLVEAITIWILVTALYGGVGA